MITTAKKVTLAFKQVFKGYGKHESAIVAAAVSFYVLLAAIPFLSLAIAVIGMLYGNDKAGILHVRTVMQQNLPASSKAILDTLAQTDYSRQTLSIFGVVGIFGSGSGIFTLLEVGFNRIWGVEERRPWLKMQILAFATTCLVIIIFGSNGIITSILTYLEAAHEAASVFTAIHFPVFWVIVGHIVTFALAATLFAVLYKMIPNRKMRTRDALFGGAIAGTAWEIAKYIFAYYLAHMGQYNRIYGSLGGLIILVVWTYYSMIILFIGAEFARLHETWWRKESHEQGPSQSVTEPMPPK